MTELEKLDPDELLGTARRLRDRIGERFPGSGLSGVAEQLVELASRAGHRCRELARPNLRLRIASGAVIVLLVAAIVGGAIVGLTSTQGARVTWADLVQVAEAGANELVLLGAAIYFFVSFETRLKRSKVVKALQQLRTLAHLIDVHQLTKTPDVIASEELRTKSSPERRLTPFELGRYLDYCTEMLSITGKIAALYGEGFGDTEALEAVNEIEDLTIGLQRKIWQKLILLQGVGPAQLGRQTRESVPRIVEAQAVEAAPLAAESVAHPIELVGGLADEPTAQDGALAESVAEAIDAAMSAAEEEIAHEDDAAASESAPSSVVEALEIASAASEGEPRSGDASSDA